MIDIENKAHCPELFEIDEFIGNDTFGELCSILNERYSPLCKIEYSGDKVLLGWNVKFKKAGKTLCTLYPRNGKFFLLIIVGRKEKPLLEELLPTMTPEFNEVYESTVEGMGQRWLLFEFSSHNALLNDALALVDIRRQCQRTH